METKKLFILFSILFSMFITKALAYSIAVENADGVTIYYNYINDGKELQVTFGNSTSKYNGSVVIPEEVTYMNRTRKVTSIAREAFKNCGVTSVIIPNSVTSIGDNAFYQCSRLTSVTISNSLTSIEGSTFRYCTRLTSITIPKSVTSIGKMAFNGCSSLSSITIPESVKSIGIYAFQDCEGLTSVTLQNGVTSVEEGVFHGCKSLTSITIPNSVTSIGDYAFYECSGLTSITIPNSVTSIGLHAFSGCSSLSSITIPESVKNIEGLAFCDCSSLISVTIPNSVTSIEGGVFKDCTGLTSVTIPNSVTSIEEIAFEGCSALTSITIPKSVTSIGHRAFDGCDIIEVISKIENPFEINGKYSDTYIKVNTFSLNTFNNATLYVPVGTIDKYKSTKGWKDFIFIEERDGGDDTPPEPKKCEIPTISYVNGQLKFESETEGVEFKASITDSDIKDYSTSIIDLTATYNISVYATKEGYENSEVATATLFWVKGVMDDEDVVAEVKSAPVLIQANDGVMNITGAPEGAAISVYDTSGRQLGNSTATNGKAKILMTQTGKLVIIKIGDKSVKVSLK